MVREKSAKQRVIVIQPYGRSANKIGDALIDPGGRSFQSSDVVKIVKKLQQKYGVVMMTEHPADFQKMGCPDPVAQPEGAPLRIWGGIINEADVFLGCDSVGQHIAHAMGTPAVVCIGATYQENISYPDSKKFQVMDVAGDKRVYDPIRISMEDEKMRSNDGVMALNDAAINEICKEIDTIVSNNLRGK